MTRLTQVATRLPTSAPGVLTVYEVLVETRRDNPHYVCSWSHTQSLTSHAVCVRRDLAAVQYRDIDAKFRTQLIQLKTTEMATSDLEKYHKVRRSFL